MFLTKVMIDKKPHYSYRILIGSPDLHKKILGTHYAYFSANKEFVYQHWKGNQFGTISWRIYIVRSVMPGQKAIKITGIDPGAELLCLTTSKLASSRLSKFLAAKKDIVTKEPELLTIIAHRINLGIEYENCLL